MTISSDRLQEMLAACEDYIANHVADFEDDPHADPVGEFDPYAIRELITELLASRSGVGREAVGAVADIAAERRRQVEAEGWTTEHDDEHTDGSLALAAACYATPVRLYAEHREFAGGPAFFDPWPSSWDDCWDKRLRYGERRRNPGNSAPDPATYTDDERRDLLVKAGALIAAEIDRLDRGTLKDNTHGA